jgi:hypothetical protein
MPSPLALLLAATLASSADSLRGERDIRLTVLRHAKDVQRCYVDEGLRRNATLDGVVEVEMTILPTGVVDATVVSSATLRGVGAAEVSACIATSARHWRFERGPYDIETVVFPFVLRADQHPPQPASTPVKST